MPHHLSAVRLQTNQMWQGRTFGLPNVGLWIDTQSCAGNTLYDNAKNSGKKLLQIEKQAESSDGNFICHVFSQDAAAHVIASSPSETVTIKT